MREFVGVVEAIGLRWSGFRPIRPEVLPAFIGVVQEASTLFACSTQTVHPVFGARPAGRS